MFLFYIYNKFILTISLQKDKLVVTKRQKRMFNEVCMLKYFFLFQGDVIPPFSIEPNHFRVFSFNILNLIHRKVFNHIDIFMSKFSFVAEQGCSSNHHQQDHNSYKKVRKN